MQLSFYSSTTSADSMSYHACISTRIAENDLAHIYQKCCISSTVWM